MKQSENRKRLRRLREKNARFFVIILFIRFYYISLVRTRIEEWFCYIARALKQFKDSTA